MNKLLTLLAIMIALIGFNACEKESSTADVAELQKEIKELKALLSESGSISNVDFVDGQMVLTFASGAKFTTATPSNIIPTVGNNGNWWVNGEDLGTKAEAEMPSIGANGNWWIGKNDTGIKAEGKNGQDGAAGTGIKGVDYDSLTAILKITLTDGTFFEYKLFYEDAIQGIKLGDLNGKYLLSSITNGDIMIADFLYNPSNQLTDINYYTTVLNAPQKNAALKRTYNASGKIETQNLVEYAIKNKAVPVGDYWYGFPERKGIELTFQEAFDEIFANGLTNYTKTGQEFFEEYYERDNPPIHKGTYLYNLNVNWHWNPDTQTEHYTYSIIKELVRTDEAKTFAITNTNNQKVLWSSRYYDWEKMWSSDHRDRYAYPADIFSADEDGNIVKNGTYETYTTFDMGNPAIEYTSEVDEITGHRLKDYMAIATEDTYNPDNMQGNYKILYKEYDIYNAGDEIQRATFAYDYEGANFTVSHEEENIIKVIVLNDKIDGFVTFKQGKEEQVLKMHYTNNKLTSVSSPVNDAANVIKIIYDSQGNAIELQVNAKQLAGKGYDDFFAELGLAYRTEAYDKELGMVVEKYTFPEDYTALLKVKYDYTMKNFMNHTFTAANPLYNVFNSTHAFKELIWAGHGSCFVAEYGSYNDGGYPTQFKGLLQMSPFDGNGNDNTELPINVGVATSYKLQYKKITE